MSLPSTSLLSQKRPFYGFFFPSYWWDAQNYDNVLASWAGKSGQKTCKWEREKLFNIAQTVQNYSAATWVVELKEGSSDSELKAAEAHSCRCCYFHFFPTLVRGNLQQRSGAQLYASHVICLSNIKIKWYQGASFNVTDFSDILDFINIGFIACLGFVWNDKTDNGYAMSNSA